MKNTIKKGLMYTLIGGTLLTAAYFSPLFRNPTPSIAFNVHITCAHRTTSNRGNKFMQYTANRIPQKNGSQLCPFCFLSKDTIPEGIDATLYLNPKTDFYEFTGFSSSHGPLYHSIPAQMVDSIIPMTPATESPRTF